MKVKEKTVVVTGAASGIGAALARAFHDSEARNIVCCDLDLPGAQAIADQVNGIGFCVDVSQEKHIQRLVEEVETSIGPIDIYCSNAGVLKIGGTDAPDKDWTQSWNVNVMAHVWAARHVVPRMIARGGGYLLNTASAAGLLNQIGAAPYGVTKHAAVGLAEWLAITHGDQGIGVSVLCPQAVDTAMIKGLEDSVATIDGVLTAAEVASSCIEAIEQERFLVLPHEKVKTYMQAKTGDYQKWISGMRLLAQRFSR